MKQSGIERVEKKYLVNAGQEGPLTALHAGQMAPDADSAYTTPNLYYETTQ